MQYRVNLHKYPQSIDDTGDCVTSCRGCGGQWYILKSGVGIAGGDEGESAETVRCRLAEARGGNRRRIGGCRSGVQATSCCARTPRRRRQRDARAARR